MRGEFQTDFIGDANKRQHGVVEINLVGMVVIPKLLGALEKFFHVGRVRNAAALHAIPFPLQG
jgi:hypothetical protein